MPSFQISDPPPTATLTETTENGRALARATVSYVVENKTPVKRAALAKVIAETQDDPGIYVIEGASSTMPTVCSIDFDPNLSQTVKVTVTVPRAQAARKGAFHLRVTNDPETDDDAIDSRPVAFEAAALPPAPVTKQPFPWWMVIAAAAILLVAGGGVWWAFFRTSYPSAEEILAQYRGQPVQDAVAFAEGRGMTVVRRIVRRDGETLDTVLEVTKNPPDGREAVITYDPGVASLIGMELAAAQALVRDTWKIDAVPVEDRDSQQPAGRVGTVVVSNDPPQQATLTYDPGFVMESLVGKGTDFMETTFISLAGQATPVPDPDSSGDDPNFCYDYIISQNPLHANNLYDTGTPFFLGWKRGTKTGFLCRIFDRPRFDYGRFMERIGNQEFDPVVILNPGG